MIYICDGYREVLINKKMKIDINNISNFELKDKTYLSNNVLRFKLELNNLYNFHKSAFNSKYETDKEYQLRIDSDFSNLKIDEDSNTKSYFEKAFKHLFKAEYYYTNGQNLISLHREEKWEIVSYETVFNYSAFLSTYYPFNYNPLGKTKNSEYKIFEQAEQKIYEELNNLKTINLPLSGITKDAKIQEVYPENFKMTLSDGSEILIIERSESNLSVNEQIIELNKPNEIETCLNCIHFQFSGMSHEMSGGSTGYCSLVRDQLIEKSVKEQMTNIWSRCSKFKMKEKADNK